MAELFNEEMEASFRKVEILVVSVNVGEHQFVGDSMPSRANCRSYASAESDMLQFL